MKWKWVESGWGGWFSVFVWMKETSDRLQKALLFIKRFHGGICSVSPQQWHVKERKGIWVWRVVTIKTMLVSSLIWNIIDPAFKNLFIFLLISWSVHHMYTIHLAVEKQYRLQRQGLLSVCIVFSLFGCLCVHCMLHKDFILLHSCLTRSDEHIVTVVVQQAVVSSNQRNAPDKLETHASAIQVF